jgi:Hemerythrin HHE cation binding domain
LTEISADSQPQTKPGEHLFEELKWIHGIIRHDLDVCKELASKVAAGAPPDEIKEQVKTLKTNSYVWKVRVNCLYYCQLVHSHHSGESIQLFPAVCRQNVEIGSIVDKLEDDQRKISTFLDNVESNADTLTKDNTFVVTGAVREGIKVNVQVEAGTAQKTPDGP